MKAFDTSIFSSGVDVRILASASSDGEVKTWTMTEDGKVTENGSYDTGNRLICLTVHDAAIERLDSFSASLKSPHDSDISSNSEESDDEEEWHGIEDI